MAVAAAVSLVIVIVFVAAVRLPGPDNTHRERRGAPVLTLSPHEDADRARQELLLDLEPLFLPTVHNTSVVTLPPQTRREPASMAATVQPKLTLSESSGGVPFPEVVEVPARPIMALSLGEPPNPWPEVGRADVLIPELPARLAYVEVARADDGKPFLQESVPKSEDSPVPAADWAPVELLIAIDSAGLVGEPVITGSTTSDEVETFFRNFVVKKLRLGARLSPGFYTVRIGP